MTIFASINSRDIPKMKPSYLLILILLISVSFLHAQHQEIREKPSIWKGKSKEAIDSTSILYAFKKGQVHGHFRYYFMATDNEWALSNYYANAAGGGLRYETAKFHGFQFGLSGFYIFNIGSSDLSAKDSITQMNNRYEIALFDLEDPSNKRDMDRLEELFLKYNFRSSNITVGKQLINTPFINLQDGRMRPTGVGGIWMHINELKNTEIEGGYIYAISPRSTVKWFDVGESIGLNPVGVDATGEKSQYAHITQSKAVLMMGATHKTTDWLKLQIWEMFTHNISNTIMAQADVDLKIKEKPFSFIAGIQLYRQDAVGNGGHENEAFAYMDKNNRAMIVSSRVGWKNKKFTTTLNYTRIGKQGRYLMPREWGRDAFYTFLPRDRNEGYGDVHAIMAKIGYNIPKSGFKSYFGAGYYDMPDVKNFALNKYGTPSYFQMNLDLSYDFKGFLKGLDAHLLIVGKIRTGEFYDDYRYVINKNNMVNYNFMLNYHF
jgi:hypothetical protein